MPSVRIRLSPMFQNIYNIYNNNSVKLSSQTLKNNLNVEIKYMRSLVIYAIIFNFLVLFYYSDKILELFVNIYISVQIKEASMKYSSSFKLLKVYIFALESEQLL